jgi:hypothetical protein
MDVKNMFSKVDDLERRALAPSHPTRLGQSLVRQGHRSLLEPDLAAFHTKYSLSSNVLVVVNTVIQSCPVARKTYSTTSLT